MKVQGKRTSTRCIGIKVQDEEGLVGSLSLSLSLSIPCECECECGCGCECGSRAHEEPEEVVDGPVGHRAQAHHPHHHPVVAAFRVEG